MKKYFLCDNKKMEENTEDINFEEKIFVKKNSLCNNKKLEENTENPNFEEELGKLGEEKFEKIENFEKFEKEEKLGNSESKCPFKSCPLFKDYEKLGTIRFSKCIAPPPQVLQLNKPEDDSLCHNEHCSYRCIVEWLFLYVICALIMVFFVKFIREIVLGVIVDLF